MGCSATKGGPGPARAFYRGQDFRLCLELGELLGRWVAILSAQHGLVMPHQELQPYNLALASLPTSELQAWKEARGRDLEWFQGKQVLCLAPGAYWKGIPGSGTWHTPLQGLGQGRRKAELAAMLARVKEGRAP